MQSVTCKSYIFTYQPKIARQFPTKAETSGGKWQYWGDGVCTDGEIAGTCMTEDDFFSIAFMFSTIYLRLEGKVPPRIGMMEPVQMGTQIAGTYMVEDDFFL